MSSKKKIEMDAGINGLDAFFTPQEPAAQQKSPLPAKHPPKRQAPDTTKITLKVTVEVASLIDEVYGKKKLRKEVGTKYRFISDILQPYLEQERDRLLELEEQEFEAKLRQRRKSSP